MCTYVYIYIYIYILYYSIYYIYIPVGPARNHDQRRRSAELFEWGDVWKSGGDERLRGDGGLARTGVSKPHRFLW